MLTISKKKKSNSIDYGKEYEKIIKKASEFTKLSPPSFPINSINNFTKFSLYTDSPYTVTSFDTNASL